MNANICIIVIAIWLMAIFASSCTHSSTQQGINDYDAVKSATEAPFRHRWWNYYKRALVYINGRYYGKAIADLTIAIQKRDRDSRRARTYGMHFIDYFPHRELGIAHFQNGDVKMAKKELLLSIEQQPSSKASYYLNQVRKKELELTAIDSSAPVIIFDKQDYFSRPTAAFSLTLKGKVLDDYYVSTLDIQGEPFRIEQAAAEVSFEHEVILHPGLNRLEFNAQDLSGNKKQRVVAINVDRQAPQLSVRDIIKSQSSTGKIIVIAGEVWDEQPEISLWIAGKKVDVNRNGYFQTRISVSDDLATSVLFKVKDSLGNQANGNIDVLNNLNQRETAEKQGDNFVLLASSEPQIISDAGTVLDDIAFKQRANAAQPPIIHIKNLVETQDVYWDQFFLEGKAIDDGKVVEVRVNGAPMIRQPGKQVFYSMVFPLKVGNNTYHIEATDNDGAVSRSTYKIVRLERKINKIGKRLSVSLLPFEKKGESDMVSEFAEDSLLNSLIKQGRFRMVERLRLESILREQNLSRSAVVDPVTASRIGKVTGAHMIILGKIIEMVNGIEAIVRMVDTETSEIIATEDVYEGEKDPNNIQNMMDGLAVKIKQHFPKLQGYVIKRNDRHIYIDKGATSDLRPGIRLLSYIEGEPIIHPVTGQALGSDTIITGELIITDLYDDYSTCKLISEKSKYPVKRKDKFITH